MPKRVTLLLAICATMLSGLLSVGLAQAPDVTVWSISVEQADLYQELETAFHERYPDWTVKFETFS